MRPQFSIRTSDCRRGLGLEADTGVVLVPPGVVPPSLGVGIANPSAQTGGETAPVRGVDARRGVAASHSSANLASKRTEERRRSPWRGGLEGFREVRRRGFEKADSATSSEGSVLVIAEIDTRLSERERRRSSCCAAGILRELRREDASPLVCIERAASEPRRDDGRLSVTEGRRSPSCIAAFAANAASDPRREDGRLSVIEGRRSPVSIAAAASEPRREEGRLSVIDNRRSPICNAKAASEPRREDGRLSVIEGRRSSVSIADAASEPRREDGRLSVIDSLRSPFCSAAAVGVLSEPLREDGAPPKNIESARPESDPTRPNRPSLDPVRLINDALLLLVIGVSGSSQLACISTSMKKPSHNSDRASPMSEFLRLDLLDILDADH